MGLFALTRGLDEQLAEADKEAAAWAVELQGNHEAIDELGWQAVDNPAMLTRLYRGLAAGDAVIRLTLARFAAVDDDEVPDALRSEGIGPCGPYLAALLATGARWTALHVAAIVYDGIGRRLPGLEAIATDPRDRSRHLAIAVCAGSPHPEDRAIALAAIRSAEAAADGSGGTESAGVVQWRCRLAESGEESMDEWLLAHLERAVDQRWNRGTAAVTSGRPQHLSRDDDSVMAMVLHAAAERGLSRAVPLAGQLLWSFDVHEACDALATLGGDDAIGALRDYRKRVTGHRQQVAPFHLPVDAALATLGEPVDLDLARWALTGIEPRRYGYPKVDDVTALRTYAARTLLHNGDSADLETLRPLVQAGSRSLREVGLDAVEKLDGVRPTPVHCDGPAIEALGDDPAALLALLERTDTVNVGRAAAAAMAIDETRDEAVRWARRWLEARPNHHLQYGSDAGGDAAVILAALGRLDRADIDRLLTGTSSAWIRHLVVDGDDMTPAPATSTIPDGVEISVSRFDGADRAFTFGTQLNGLAISPDGSRYAVVGSEAGKICDAGTGELIASIELRWNWGYDVAFSADGSILLACYHGVHVETYDAATGERLCELTVPGAGVPDGAKRCVISPDDQLAFSVDSSGQVSCHDLRTGEHRWTHAAGGGAYEAIACSPDGGRLVASHVKTGGGEQNYLTVHDPRTGRAERIDVPTSMWALAFSPDGGTIAMGGEASKVRLCDPTTFAVRRTLPLAGTTRLCFSTDGTRLYGCSKNGRLVVWTLDGDDEGTELLSGVGGLWAVTPHPEGGVWATGSDGVVYRFDGHDAQVGDGGHESGAVHRDQVRWIEPTADGVLSAGWDGQLLSWPTDGGAAEVLWSQDRRINCVAPLGDDQLALATSEALIVVARDGTELRRIDGDFDTVATSADGTELAVDQRAELVVLDAATLTGEQRLRAASASIEAIAALPDGWLVSSEAGEVSRVRDGEVSWTRSDHGAERLDRGNPHRSVSSLLVTDRGYLSGATDDTVRVYRWADDGTATLRARIHPTDISLFSRLSVSPSGRLLAVPFHYRLEVFDLETGALCFSLFGHEEFEGQELCVARFVDDATLLLGTENGGIFRVGFTGVVSGPVNLDGSEITRLIELTGEPTLDGTTEVERLERWIGHPLPSETRALLISGVRPGHPDAEHPELVPDFFGGLPDIEAFLDSFRNGHQGRFAATCHFLGLYPIGQALQYGDFMFAMAVLEPHAGDQLGGVMYYDERECGTRGATVSQFLHQAIRRFWEEMDEQADGLDEDEEPDYDTGDVRDCFVFEHYDPRHEPPDALDLPETIQRSWEPHWRWRLANTSRWWLAKVLGGDHDVQVDHLPTEAMWQAEKAEVATRYHQAMYWLLAHTVLDNRDELAECIILAKSGEAEGPRALAAHIEAHPDLGERWSDAREAIFERIVRSRT